VLAGLLALWWLPRLGGLRARLALLAGVAAAPVVWALVDLAVTGDPLHSLHATSELADELGREQGLAAVPGAFVRFVGATVRPPVAVLAVVGVALALWRPGWRAARVPLALLVAGVVTFVGTGIVGLAILPRYLTVPSVAMCVFAGYALAGFTALPAGGPRRRLWARASAAAAALGVVGLVLLAPTLANVRDELRFIRATHDGLVGLLDDPAVRRARACGPLTFPTYRLVPDARWHLQAPAAAVGARSDRRRERGVAVFVLTRRGLRRFGFADGASPLTNLPDDGYEALARNARFSAFVSCAGRAPSSAPAAAG
jgi:hypothetical protein